MSSEEGENARKLGMMSGVFVPTLLTILGVILFLRLGWVVGQVGILGAWTVIGLAFFITGITALSMSSIVTNMKIGPGGAYSIISRSLGMEVGGSIGVPLYISLALSMVMYIFGFREGLRMLFPQYSPLLIDFAVFVLLFLIVFLSTSLAFKVQYIILVIVIGAIISFMAAGIDINITYQMTQARTEGSFWIVFAVFFPAATGILAGANMSGELKDPRHSIPIGTLSAILVSLVVYLLLAFWLAGTASPEELVTNFTVMIDRAYYGPLVLAGLLAATFSSALNSMVGASRILQAMGEHKILPGNRWFSKKSSSGEPKNAILVTAVIVAVGLLARNLNTIAPLITMFFLLTYAMMNVVILLEQQLELVSFRPLLKIPRFVPFVGAGGCFFAMFIINPIFSFLAVIVVTGFYYVLMHRELKKETPYGDVRSSLFVALAEWAAKKSRNLPSSQERAWVPHVLIPAKHPTYIRGISELVRDITYPRGSVSMLGVDVKKRNQRMEDQFKYLAESFKDEGIYSDWTIIEGKGFLEGTSSSMQTLKRSLFSPNILFLRMPRSPKMKEDVSELIKDATENMFGVVLFANHPTAGLGRHKKLNIWLPKKCLKFVEQQKLPNCDLSILMAYKLKINWHAELTLLVPTEDEDSVDEVKEDVQKLLGAARIPVDEVHVKPTTIEEWLEDAPQADLNIFSLPPSPDFEKIMEQLEKSNSACMYCRDSTKESVLA